MPAAMLVISIRVMIEANEVDVHGNHFITVGGWRLAHHYWQIILRNTFCQVMPQT
ncbi:MAG: hypothetical protein GPOALKHO_001918 [Sodalis sp.]|nr:MAG: hypothetical protein GPOALKHO_001918 [Sodalis sp.]